MDFDPKQPAKLDPGVPWKARNDDERELFEENSAKDLDDDELIWVDRYETLLSHGYQLRPRFRPGWKAPWVGRGLNPFYFEDSIPHDSGSVIDAVRLSDGAVVAIKMVTQKSSEEEIGQYFSVHPQKDDPTNHCIPFLDHFNDDKYPNLAFVVMPVVRSFNDPPFERVSEVVQFVQQALEGLAFLHKHNVAHRDCSFGNIMMDAPAMYPNGFHFTVPTFDRSGTSEVSPVSRFKIKGKDAIKYYFIDFNISIKFREGEEHSTPGFGHQCHDKDVPEYRKEDAYDPFPLDVRLLGNMFKKAFCDEFKNVTWLDSVLEGMRRDDPKDRITAAQALEQFTSIARRKASWYSPSLRWRLRPKDENPAAMIYKDSECFFQETGRVAGGILLSPYHLARAVFRSRKDDSTTAK